MRVGQRYIYQGTEKPKELVIDRVEDNIAFFTFENGERSCIICNFKGVFNSCLTEKF